MQCVMDGQYLQLSDFGGHGGHVVENSDNSHSPRTCVDAPSAADSRTQTVSADHESLIQTVYDIYLHGGRREVLLRAWANLSASLSAMLFMFGTHGMITSVLYDRWSLLSFLLVSAWYMSFTVVGLYTVVAGVHAYGKTTEISQLNHFITQTLGFSTDIDLISTDWDVVRDRLLSWLDSLGIQVWSHSIDEIILRKDNFTVIVADVLSRELGINTPSFWSSMLFSSYMEYVVQLSLFSRFVNVVTGRSPVAESGMKLSHLGILGLLLVAPVSVFLTVMLVVRDLIDFRFNRIDLNDRVWTGRARCLYRELNEYPHVFNRRLHSASNCCIADVNIAKAYSSAWSDGSIVPESHADSMLNGTDSFSSDVRCFGLRCTRYIASGLLAYSLLVGLLDSGSQRESLVFTLLVVVCTVLIIGAGTGYPSASVDSSRVGAHKFNGCLSDQTHDAPDPNVYPSPLYGVQRGRSVQERCESLSNMSLHLTSFLGCVDRCGNCTGSALSSVLGVLQSSQAFATSMFVPLWMNIAYQFLSVVGVPLLLIMRGDEIETAIQRHGSRTESVWTSPVTQTDLSELSFLECRGLLSGLSAGVSSFQQSASVPLVLKAEHLGFHPSRIGRVFYLIGSKFGQHLENPLHLAMLPKYAVHPDYVELNDSAESIRLKIVMMRLALEVLFNNCGLCHSTLQRVSTGVVDR